MILCVCYMYSCFSTTVLTVFILTIQKKRHLDDILAGHDVNDAVPFRIAMI